VAKTRNISAEIRARAVRLVREHAGDYPSEYAAMTAVAQRLGIGSAETLRKWVRQNEIDGGGRAGLTTNERQRLRELEREVKDLRRANEILREASIVFATELDGRRKK
jgi:transposase